MRLYILKVQNASGSEKSNASVDQNQLLGLVSVVISSASSGFAGVYFEKILKKDNKDEKIPIFLKNIQLGIFGTVTGMLAVYFKDGTGILENGFFFGFDSLVWFCVLLSAFGGLLVAAVVAEADSIIKGFATSISIVVSTVISVFIFEFQVTLAFVAGAFLVTVAVVVYSKFEIEQPKLLPLHSLTKV